MSVEQRQHRLELRRLESIVVIEKRHHFAAGLAEPEIPGRAHAAIDAAGMLAPSDARVPRRETRCDLPRRVGRPVVDDEQLPIRDGLRLHALDRLRQESLAVVHDEHDAAARSAHAGESPRDHPSRV